MRVYNLQIVILTISWLGISPVLSQGVISNNGKYVCASIDKSLDGNDTWLVVESTNHSWKKEIRQASTAKFTPDGDKLIYKIKDTLYVLFLGSEKQIRVAGVNSYKQPTSGEGRWLAYQLKDEQHGLVVCDLISGITTRYNDVSDWFFDDKGSTLFMHNTTFNQDTSRLCVFKCITLVDNKSCILFSALNAKIVSYVFDSKSDQIAFIIKQNKPKGITNEIWHYKIGASAATLLVNNDTKEIDSSLVVSDSRPRFSDFGSKVYFYLREKKLPKPRPGLTKVDVWSYTDIKLQSLQLKDADVLHKYMATIDISSLKVIRLENDNEKIIGSASFNNSDEEFQITDSYALICKFPGDLFAYDVKRDGKIFEGYSMAEYNWNKYTSSEVYLISLKDGYRKKIKLDVKATSANFPYFRIAPNSDFIIYYDNEQKNYFSYNLHNSVSENLTSGINTFWDNHFEGGQILNYYAPVGIECWGADKKCVFIWDRYRDLWKIDISGKAKPSNITNGFARRNNLWFGIEYESGFNGRKKEIGFNDIILLRATGVYNNSYYEVGYFIKTMKNKSDPIKVLDGNFKYVFGEKVDNLHLVTFESAECPSSFIFTKDFIQLNHITSSQPERRKGLRQELIKWKSFDGSELRGVLIKPDNFEAGIKHPIIFWYYEQNEGRYNSFKSVVDNIYNPILDRGYLIFFPDVKYTIGETGKSVYNSVVSAAQYLSKMPYVDASRMGIIGGSFGGYETNYLLTHTKLFAAAISYAGHSDFISSYGAEDKDTQGLIYTAGTEVGQSRIGVTLWDRPDIYIENSPIFFANKVTTPVLLVHNRNDFRVPFNQSVEFFKALRRLGKRAWLLQYDDGNHLGAVLGGNQDLGIRNMQFFDHYLRGAPAPIWMTKGIPARMKGIITGYEYDTIIKTPRQSLLIENKDALTSQQKKLLQHKTTVTNSGRIVDVVESNNKNAKKEK